MYYKISDALIKSLLEYLSTRPYREVCEGISALQSLEKIKEEKPE